MCIFCQSELNEKFVLLETKFSLLIANYFPMGAMSLLAIPKRHVESITRMSPKELSDISQLIALAVNKVKAEIRPEGLNVLLNEGEIAGQTVNHLHFHIIARQENDGVSNLMRTKEKVAITAEQLAAIKALF